MNLWAAFLADTPPTLQRLIARRHRISLPRRCSAQERLLRLRQALCHARTVRAIYFSLPPDTQAALQHLRAIPRGLNLNELTDRFGPIRPFSHIVSDFKPRSLSEQLLLLGFLLPRPASHRHPIHFLLPPEVRAALPRPLNLPDHGLAPDPVLPLAARAARVILLTCAERPLPLCADGTLRAESLRAVLARLALPDQVEATALCRFLWPLLTDMGLLAPHHDAAALAPAGMRFLARSASQQLAQLRAAWVRAPRTDAWLQSLRVNLEGVDWPLLRRRLLAWAAALPSARLLDATALYSALADALGPLADAQTHGFRPVDRAPWQPKCAALVWDAAMRGPLAWLGALAWTTDREPRTKNQEPRTEELEDGGWRIEDGDRATARTGEPCVRRHPTTKSGEPRKEDGRAGETDLPLTPSSCHLVTLSSCHLVTPSSHRWVFRPPTDADDLPLLEEVPQSWQYGAPGEVQIPHAALDRALLALLPFARWEHFSATHLSYRITRRSLAAAARGGHHPSALRKLLRRQAGPLPPEWEALLGAEVPAVQIVYAAVVTSDDPQVLSRAAQARSVRRYLDARLAPGVAITRPERAASLARVLERQGLAVTVQSDPHIAQPRDFTPAECATLLEVCAGLRALAQPEAIPPHLDILEERLRAALPATLQASVAPIPDDSAEEQPAPAMHFACGSREEQQAPEVLEMAALPTTARVGTVGLALVLTMVSLLLGLLRPSRRWGQGERAEATADEPLSCPDAAPETALPPETSAFTDRSADPELLTALRRAIGRREVLQIEYCDAAGTPSTRIIRPLRLEHHGSCFYLHAFCTLRRAERVFRLDRLGAWTVLGRRGRRGDPLMRRLCPRGEPPPARPTAPPARPSVGRGGFFAPPAQLEGSPLVRVWLEE